VSATSESKPRNCVSRRICPAWKARSSAEEDEACRGLKQKLEAMGPVNMMALEEYQETAERHGFLETQRKDLIDAIENTQSTIREIDQITRQKFDEAFARINQNFSKPSPVSSAAVRASCA
jgi:chromosome segregation ATPase